MRRGGAHDPASRDTVRSLVAQPAESARPGRLWNALSAAPRRAVVDRIGQPPGQGHNTCYRMHQRYRPLVSAASGATSEVAMIDNVGHFL